MADEMVELSPNHRAKRHQIIAAAQQVILRAGPAQCTTREVARESGLNQGLIYYYFNSIDEIVDAAMGAFADELAAAIMRTHETSKGRVEGFHVLFENYLGVFKTRPGLHIAWFEYWLMSTRAGRTEQLVAIHDNVISLLADALEATGADEATVRARVLVSYIIGVLVRSWAVPRTFDSLEPEIASLISSTPQE